MPHDVVRRDYGDSFVTRGLLRLLLLKPLDPLPEELDEKKIPRASFGAGCPACGIMAVASVEPQGSPWLGHSVPDTVWLERPGRYQLPGYFISYSEGSLGFL